MAFEEFIEDVAELATVLHLSMNGIAMLESRHAISKAVQPFLEIEDEVVESVRHNRVEPRGGFVKVYDGRVESDRAGESGAFAHAA